MRSTQGRAMTTRSDIGALFAVTVTAANSSETRAKPNRSQVAMESRGSQRMHALLSHFPGGPILRHVGGRVSPFAERNRIHRVSPESSAVHRRPRTHPVNRSH